MPHPGIIVYANTPNKDGWRFFYVVYYPPDAVYRLRCRPEEGEVVEVEGAADIVVAEMLQRLPRHGDIPQRAAQKVTQYAATH